MHEPQRRFSFLSFIFLLAFAIIVDIAQLILNLFVVGLFINRGLDVFIGAFLIFIFHLLDVLDAKTIISLGLSFIVEEIPLLDIAPAWSLDVVYVYIRVKHEDDARIAAYHGETVKTGVVSTLAKNAAVAGAAGGAVSGAAAGGAGAAGAKNAGAAGAGAKAGAKAGETTSRSVGGRYAPEKTTPGKSFGATPEKDSSDLYKRAPQQEARTVEQKTKKNPYSQDGQQARTKESNQPKGEKPDRAKDLHEAVQRYDFKREEREREEARRQGIRDSADGQDRNPQEDMSEEPELVG